MDSIILIFFLMDFDILYIHHILDGDNLIIAILLLCDLAKRAQNHVVM